MGDRTAIAKLWAGALAQDEQATEALRDVVAEDIVTVSALGTTEGRDDVLASLGGSPVARFFGEGNWSEPAFDGDVATIACGFPPSAPIGGVSVELTFDGDRIVRAEMSVIPARPPEARPVALTETMKEAVNGALANGTPVTVAYTNDAGRPRISLRGSTQVHSNHQLAMWIRNPDGGIVGAVGSNPHIALLYRDPKTRTTYQFTGRAHVEDDDATRERVYASSPEVERNLDPQRRGVPMIVDLERVEGRDADGPVLMVREVR